MALPFFVQPRTMTVSFGFSFPSRLLGRRPNLLIAHLPLEDAPGSTISAKPMPDPPLFAHGPSITAQKILVQVSFACIILEFTFVICIQFVPQRICRSNVG
jgi:hypothetical protein